eukprot:COSAG01_NODE_2450_length_7674_cov_86.009109_9_plen_60_part_00
MWNVKKIDFRHSKGAYCVAVAHQAAARAQQAPTTAMAHCAMLAIMPAGSTALDSVCRRD